MSPFLIKVMLYSVNAVLFEPNWNPTGMTEAMNIGHWGSPICYWELLEVLHRILQSALMKHRDCFFLCLSFSEINLENTSVFYSFRQTLKHMALWVRPLLGTCAWHPRCSGDGRNGTRVGGRGLLSTKKNSETNLWDMHGAGALLLFPPLLWAPGAYHPALPSHYSQYSFSLFHFTYLMKLTLSRLRT